jgi:RNA polymerase sigma-70 factor (ECF subfamily)
MAKKNTNFKANYQRYKDKIFNYFYYRLNFNRALAEDMTSEVFLKAYEKYDTYEADRPFQAWIYAIARNHLLNHYRDRKCELDIEAVCGLSSNDCEKVEIGLECERMLKLIYDMDTYHREVLLLRFVDGFSNDEIAEALGKDNGAIRTQMSRALKELRDNIEI